LFAQKWAPLHDVRELVSLDAQDLRYPSVYLLAYSNHSMAGQRVQPRDVFYVGMTNSAGGLKQRLKQFQSSIEGGNGHGPAYRFYEMCAKGKAYSQLQTKRRFFFVTYSIPCVSQKSKASAHDWRQMGKVALLEYEAIACVLERTGKLPKLNDLAKDVFSN
jgi:hypothetical protein